MELMLNIGSKYLGVVFILKAMSKFDHLGVLFQELRNEGSRFFDMVSRLLLITSQSHIGVDTIPNLRTPAQIYKIPILSQLRLTQAGPE